MPLAHLPLSALQKIGAEINRPQGVAVGADGRVWASDCGSACAIIRKDGTVKRIGAAGGVPKDIRFDRQGNIVISNFGLQARLPGPLQRLDTTTGGVHTLCADVGGRKLSASNASAVLPDGSIYCTHSTNAPSVNLGLRPGQSDGFVYRVDARGRASIVAEGLSFPTGCCVDPMGKALYVVQSAAANVLRFEIDTNGALRPGFPYGPKFGVIPDTPPAGTLEPRERARLGYGEGCAFDADGNLWIALFLANRIIAITPTLTLRVIVDDPDMTMLRAPTSLCFGGADLRDLYIGSLMADYVVKTRSPVPGAPLCHQM